MTTAAPTPESWLEYYQRLHSANIGHLDSSNTRTQAQTYGLVIEAAGPIVGARCMDIGCGRGQIVLALASLGASDVLGIDIVDETIQDFRQRYPHARWETGSPDNDAFCQNLGMFDVILATEVLQLVDWKKSLRNLWPHVSPGGRFVAMIPNKDNAIVQKTIARFEGSYDPPNSTELAEFVPELRDLECWCYRGMDFGQDQRIVPYVTTQWMDTPIAEFTPNRLIFVLKKQGPATA